MNPLSRKFKMRIQGESTPRVRRTAGRAAWPEQEAVNKSDADGKRTPEYLRRCLQVGKYDVGGAVRGLTSADRLRHQSPARLRRQRKR